MALPFDLRAFVAQDEYAEWSGSDAGPRSVRHDAHRSRAILVPPELLGRIQRRDVEAFRELVRLTYVPCLRFAETFLHASDAAEDIVQEVFAFVWDRGRQWDPDDPAAYLFASVRNRALNEVRRREREARRSQRASERDTSERDARDTADPLDRIIGSEADLAKLQLVDDVLATFTERQRTAYDLRYRRGLTVPAVAHVLGITPKGAEQLVSRVTRLMVQRLRARLEHSTEA
jgi:RNA polymerase sigma-70 factor (ECF subfamily)